eukprot:JP435981.1.p4 GENE.JP435981.1~~JP435981.1.p4  ORF type:complete len:59 (-),score=2.78 JP435981.1:397-573(-)
MKETYSPGDSPIFVFRATLKLSSDPSSSSSFWRAEIENENENVSVNRCESADHFEFWR